MRFLGKLVQSKVAAIGLAIVLLVLVCAIFGPWIVPYDPAEQDIMQRMLPPLARADSGEFHLLGTDALGRDLLSRLMVGARVSLLVGVAIGRPAAHSARNQIEMSRGRRNHTGRK